MNATSKPHEPTKHDDPGPPASEDSVPQDEGTDNRWQMEPFENREEGEGAA